ncbi:MAG: hypothetical protein IJD00_03845 [Clostridia bacterium]|nr:hypothetical protein [Clostridia bacterium]MBQ3058062.1 hypothetical protein [Clostridia bacterium]
MAGFRRSLFGFNTDDVLEYIEKTHRSFSKKQNALNEKADNLANELQLSKEQYENLMAEKAIVDEKLDAFIQKYDEIEKLSENIGKLYLVAQANAQAIMKNSESSLNISNAEVEKNLNSIDEAHASLDEIRANIVKTSEDFVSELDELIQSLVDTKSKITANNQEANETIDDFDKFYNSIVK